MLIYDGDCGFCTTTALWIKSRLATPISVVPWQQIADLGALGLTVADVSTAVYWVDSYGRTERGAHGVARALTHAKGWLVLIGWLMMVPPFRQLATLVYPVVARYRHLLPGATAACAMRAPSSPLSRGLPATP